MWFCSSYIIILLLFGILSGLIIGIFLEGNKWRSNAKQIYRIESFGHLYKVKLDDHYNSTKYGLNKKFVTRKELNEYIDNIDEENNILINKFS